MTNNIGQFQINQNRVNQIPANFNGNPSAIPLGDTAVNQAKDSQAGRMFMDMIPMDALAWKRFIINVSAMTGITWLIDSSLNRLCNPSGKYEDSIMYKWIKAIDKNPTTKSISQFIENTGTAIKNGFSRLIPKAGNRRAIVDSIKTGTTPVWNTAKSQMLGQQFTAVEHIIEELRKLEPAKLQQLGLKRLSKHLTDKTLTASQIFSKITPALKKNTDKLKELGLNLSFNTVRNFEETGKTFLSRLLPKSKAFLSEVATGQVVGGGLFGLLMNAFMLSGCINRAMTAPKGEKISTFMEDFVGNWVSFVATMPLVCKLYYHTAGLRYLGAEGGKEGVQAAIKALETKIANNLSKKEAMEEAVKISKNLNKAVPFILKPFKFLGRILSVGLNNIPAVTTKGKIWNKIKAGGGGIFRFVILAFILAPIFQKPFVKLSHMIFGRPTKSVLDPDQPEKTSENPANSTSDQMNNFLNITKPKQPDIINNQVTQSHPDNQNIQPVQAAAKIDDDKDKQSDNKADRYTFIPSGVKANIPAQSSGEFSEQIGKANAAEKYADKVFKELNIQ